MTAPEELVLLSDDELFEALGRSVSPREFGPGDPSSYIRLGKAWFEEHARQYQEQICSSDAVRVFITGGSSLSAAVEAATLIDTLAGLMNREVVAVFAVILTRRGLAAYCRTHL
ncbi:hypothetical protein [uncultured Cellulomonas sp.]|uniref:hypothetical protein n=1 Tax=uncultured Cellulomonas sp. TaxID=189682 RepID=UPI0028E8F1E6|nr:hypothetical protein [uncultured Cellulomonas sp.]